MKKILLPLLLVFLMLVGIWPVQSFAAAPSEDASPEFASFTVDFHYNGVDYSINGKTSLLLSELFEIMGISRAVSDISAVTFSDTSLVSVSRADNDWRLTSHRAFSTSETLSITFGDGDVIVIDVTDAEAVRVNFDPNTTYVVETTNDLGTKVTYVYVRKQSLPATVKTRSSLKWPYTVVQKQDTDYTTLERSYSFGGYTYANLAVSANAPIGNNTKIDYEVGGAIHAIVYESISYSFDSGKIAPEKVSNMPSGGSGKELYTATNNFTLPSNIPTTEYYTFGGWLYTDYQGNTATAQAGAYASLVTDTVFTAIWNPVDYSISYTLNGGEVGTPNPTSYNIETNTFTLNNPTREGYEFIGWTGSNGDIPSKTVSIQTGSVGSKSYTANWKALDYSITYDLDGGMLSSENPPCYNIETETFTLNNPSKDGHSFLGWTGTDLNAASQNVSIEKGSTGNRSYTATWDAEDYGVTFHHYLLGTADKVYEDSLVFIEFGTVITDFSQYAQASNADYAYKSSSAESITVGSSHNEVSLFYAPTKAKYSVEIYKENLSTDGYDKTMHEQTGTIGDVVSINSVSYLSEGFSFDENNEGNVLSGTVSADGNLVLKLYYKRNIHTVTYATGAGGDEVTGMPSAMEGSHVYGTEVTVSTAAPSREGYRFTGWVYDPAVTVVNGKFTMPDSNVTICAQWDEKTAEIKYLASTGGTVTRASETVNVDTGVPDGSEAKPDAGYKFVGWYLDDKEVSRAAAFKPTKGNNGLYEDVTYIAKFERQTGTLILDHQGAGAAIVTLRGKDLNITLVLDKDVAISDLPTGTYTVSASGAAASAGANVDNSAPVITADNTTGVKITVSSQSTSWFTGFSRVINSYGN